MVNTRVSNIISGMKKMKVSKKTENSEMELNNVLTNALNPNIDFEKGGALRMRKGRPLFKDLATRVVNDKGREGLSFAKVKGKNVRPLWHYHPYNRGWWPSSEDIDKVNSKPHIIVTRYGFWAFIKTDPRIPQSKVPGREIDNFGNYLISLNLPYWETQDLKQFKINMKLAKDAIAIYSKWVSSYGIKLNFFSSKKGVLSFLEKHL